MDLSSKFAFNNPSPGLGHVNAEGCAHGACPLFVVPLYALSDGRPPPQAPRTTRSGGGSRSARRRRPNATAIRCGPLALGVWWNGPWRLGPGGVPGAHRQRQRPGPRPGRCNAGQWGARWFQIDSLA